MLKKINQLRNQIVFKNYLYLLVIQGSNVLLPLISFPYLVRVLGTTNYGIVMMAHSLSIFLGIIVDFGFNISATREVAVLKDDKKMLSKYYTNILFIKTFLILISFTILLFIVTFVYKINVYKEVYLLSFGVVIGQALFPTWFFISLIKFNF